jgi:hypothetical protein
MLTLIQLVILAHRFYMSICTNLSWIDQVGGGKFQNHFLTDDMTGAYSIKLQWCYPSKQNLLL